MTELVRKDIVVARWFLAFILPLYALQLAVMSHQVPMFLLTTLLFSGLLGFGSIALEDHQNTQSCWCSLPVSRRDIVLARYLSTGLGLFLGLGTSWLVGRAASRLVGFGAGHDAAWSPGLLAHFSLFLVLALLAALFLPCYFRYGIGKGLIVFSALGVGALIVVPLLLHLAFLLAGSSRSLLDPALWRANAEKFDAEQRERLVHQGVAILAFLTLAAALLSSGLSVRFYEKRDL